MIIHLLHFLPLAFPLPFLCWSASSSQQSSSQRTHTTSGAASPIASEGGTAATTGSIAVGEQGKYQEAGSVDLSNARDVGGTVGTITTGNNGQVIIGDPNASKTISDLAQQFANTVQSIAPSGGGGAAAAAPASSDEPLNYKTIGLILAGITAILGALYFIFGRRNA